MFEGLFCSEINTTSPFGISVNISPAGRYFVSVLKKRYFVTDTYFPADVTESGEILCNNSRIFSNRLADALNLFCEGNKQSNQG